MKLFYGTLKSFSFRSLLFYFKLFKHFWYKIWADKISVHNLEQISEKVKLCFKEKIIDN